MTLESRIESLHQQVIRLEKQNEAILAILSDQRDSTGNDIPLTRKQAVVYLRRALVRISGPTFDKRVIEGEIKAAPRKSGDNGFRRYMKSELDRYIEIQKCKLD